MNAGRNQEFLTRSYKPNDYIESLNVQLSIRLLWIATIAQFSKEKNPVPF